MRLNWRCALGSLRLEVDSGRSYKLLLVTLQRVQTLAMHQGDG